MFKHRLVRRPLAEGAAAGMNGANEINCEKNSTRSSIKKLQLENRKVQNKTCNEHPPPDGPIRLRREIGLLEAVAVTIGSVVGSGIFVSPTGVLLSCGSVGLSLIVWFACGFLSLSGSLCYAELGTTFPGSGGTYLYLNKAYGPLIAFLFLWVTVLIAAPCTMAILGLTVANYLTQAFFPMGCSLPDSALRAIAAATIVILTFVNCYDVRGTIKAQNVFTFTKISALLLIIAFGLAQVYQGRTENFVNPFENTVTDPGSLSIAFYSGFFSYNGWTALNFMTEELKEPTKTLPRAIYISLPIVTLIYMLTNCAYFLVITPTEIRSSGAIAVTFAQKLFGSAACVMPLFVTISTIGSLTITIMYSSRLIYAAAREGQCPNILSHITVSHRTPSLALIFLALTSLIYLITSDIFSLINISSYVYSLANLGVIVGMLQMRKKYPDLKRPLKVSFIHPALYFIISIFSIIFPIYVRPIEVSLAWLITFTGWPIYELLIKRDQPKWLTKISASVTFVLQKIFMAVSEEDD